MIMKTKLLSKSELMKKTGITFGKKTLMITYHPVTLEREGSVNGFKELLISLEKLADTNFIFTAPNADTLNQNFKKMIKDFIKKNKKTSFFFESMGRTLYLSTLKYIDGIVGNSSSGISEAPSFKLGTVNIGDRQKGRLRADSVVDCSPNNISITNSLKYILHDKKFKNY